MAEKESRRVLNYPIRLDKLREKGWKVREGALPSSDNLIEVERDAPKQEKSKKEKPSGKAAGLAGSKLSDSGKKAP